jgi:CRISPR-associated protein Cas5h
MNRDKFIVVDIWGDFAHFSHPSTVYSSITYPVPPKTAIMGLLGAICGKKREEYKDWLEEFKYAVSILSPIRKIKLSFNGTSQELSMSYFKKGFVKSTKHEAKQFYREMIVNPKFRVFLWLETSKTKDEIERFIVEHKSCYVPYLGINSCIADFKYIDIEYVEQINDESFKADTTIEQDFYNGLSEKGEHRVASQIMPFDIASNERVFTDFKGMMVEIKGEPLEVKNNQNSWSIKTFDREREWKVFLC